MDEKQNSDAADRINGQTDSAHKQELQNPETQQDGSEDQKKDGPLGGFDETPMPKIPPGVVGYTLKFTLHQARNLGIGDAHTLSSDPFVLAQLNTDLPTRHKEDPKLRFRTETVRRNTDPEWNAEWIVANVPSTGFKLKLRVYDEDPADHDDLLGKVHVDVPAIDDDWPGIKHKSYRLMLRNSSTRALLIRTVAVCLRFVKHYRGDLFLSVEMLGRTQDENEKWRTYTVGPCRWTKHYSPLLGRITNIRDPEQTKESQCPVTDTRREKQIEHYNFQANEMQFAGPVPAELYHRFVEFKPWVKRMFTTSGFSGVVLGKALHHQHAHVYNFDRSTVWGDFPEGPCTEMTKKFLDLVHYDQGGRIFTYVLTLDALFRFTETGKEFGIDMLSKHTMHSDVSIYIAFSGEFFIRRLKHKRRPPPPEPVEGSSEQDPPNHEPNETHPPHDLQDGPPDDDPPKDPSRYELVIDNDSGTYRPNADMLPVLASFLSKSLPGLHIQTLDCNADREKQQKMKAEQRERKKREGDQIIYTQGDASSISSSEDERLDTIEEAYQDDSNLSKHAPPVHGAHRASETIEQATRAAKLHQQERLSKMQRVYGTRSKIGGGIEEEPNKANPVEKVLKA